jgi:hypothetical protein
MSAIRGMSRKSFLLSPEREVLLWACIQPNLISGEAVGSPRIPDRPVAGLSSMGSWRAGRTRTLKSVNHAVQDPSGRRFSLNQ